MKKLLFLFNPMSGKANAKEHLFEIVDAFTKEGYLVTVYPTQRQNDGFSYAREHSDEYDMVVCSGGDGTLNETVSGMLCNGDCEAALGYIPSGSTNDFAVSLQIPKTLNGALRNILEGKEFLCDVGSFNGRYFNYVAAFGLFTEVSYATPQELKNVLGHQAYIIESIKSLSNQKRYRICIESGDFKSEDVYVYGMVSNSKQVGGMKGITGKNVKLNDGLFEVMLIKAPKNPLDMQLMVNGFLLQENNDMVVRFKTDEITFVSEDAIPWVLDGEFGGNQTEVTVKVFKERVKYILSKK